jgi:hypothetical protein
LDLGGKEKRAVYGEYALNRNIVSKSYTFFGKEENAKSEAEQSPIVYSRMNFVALTMK